MPGFVTNNFLKIRGANLYLSAGHNCDEWLQLWRMNLAIRHFFKHSLEPILLAIYSIKFQININIPTYIRNFSFLYKTLKFWNNWKSYIRIRVLKVAKRKT